MVRGPIAGSSLSQPSKQLMADVKQSSSMLKGRRRSVFAEAADSAGCAGDAMAVCCVSCLLTPSLVDSSDLVSLCLWRCYSCGDAQRCRRRMRSERLKTKN